MLIDAIHRPKLGRDRAASRGSGPSSGGEWGAHLFAASVAPLPSDIPRNWTPRISDSRPEKLAMPEASLLADLDAIADSSRAELEES